MSRQHISWWEPVFQDNEKDLLSSVIDSGFVNDGPMTERLEQQFAALNGVPYAVATTSGTVALFMALAACGVKRDDEVIVPDLTFIATANAVSLCGAKPILVDVDPTSRCISVDAFERAITARTRAVIPVHVSGRAADVARVTEIARKRGLFVIEDAAEALGSRTAQGALGSFGDAGCFSLTANKTITSGQGGIIITKSDDINRRLRALKDQGRPVRGTGGNDRHSSLGYNFKYTDIQAALALGQLRSLEWRTKHLRRAYTIYSSRLAECRKLTLGPFDIAGGECPQWVDLFSVERDELHDFLLERGVETRKFWFPLHTQAPYKGDSRPFPVASRSSAEGLWLPCAFNMSASDFEHVSGLIRKWDKT